MLPNRKALSAFLLTCYWAALKMWQQLQRQQSGQGMQRGKSGSSKRQWLVCGLQDAGHYAFLDQPQVFLDHLHRICQPYIRSRSPQVRSSHRANGCQQLRLGWLCFCNHVEAYPIQ